MARMDLKQFPIRKKLFVVLIPMVLTVCFVVSVFAVAVCYRFLKDNTDRYLRSTVQGLITNIDLQLERIEKDSLLLLQNAETAQLLKEAEVEAPAYMEIRANLGRYFINFQLAHPDVESIYLWDNHLAGVSTLPSSISQQEMADYTAMADLGQGRTIWLVLIRSSLGNTVIPVVRRVNDTYTLRPIGTLALYVKQVAFASIATDFSPPLDGEIFIANTDGVSIFSSADSSPAVEGNRRDRPRAFYDVEYFSDYTNWVYTYRVASSTIYAELIHSTVLIACCCALVLCASFYGILRFSFHISRRLSSFSEEVQQIQRGKQDLEVTCDGNDEITALGAVFNRMIRTQNQSILHEQELQRMQHESEMRALKTEINPHFLYNTLEAINWIARQHRVEQISRMTSLLAGIMRYSLSKQKRLSSVGKEVEQVRRYLELQQMRFGEKL